MTLLTTTVSITYNGVPPQDTFVFNFRVDQKEDLNVIFDGVTQSQGDWEFGDPIHDPGNPAGGTVVLNDPLIAATVVTLARLVPPTQEVDYQPFDAFPAETHEGALDKITMLIQQGDDATKRSIRFPLGDKTTPTTPSVAVRANKYLKFNPDGSVGVVDAVPLDDAVATITIRQDGSSGSPVMLGIDASDANNPELFVQPTNVQNGLVQLVDGKIPPEVFTVQGVNTLGAFRGDDECPKNEDIVGTPPYVCTPGADYRSPTELFGGPFNNGDIYVITMGEAGDPSPPLSGSINMQADDQTDTTSPIAVEKGDGILYLERQTQPNGHEIYEGWYHWPRLTEVGDASDIVFDDAALDYFLGANVQAAISAGDSSLGNLITALVDTELPKKLDKPIPSATDNNICIFTGNNAADGGESIQEIKDYVDAAVASALNNTHPIGSYFIGPNPNGTITGTWVSVEDVMLIGASATYPTDSTGGSADAIIPSHNHVFSGNVLPAHHHTWAGQSLGSKTTGSSSPIVPGTSNTSSVSAGTPSGSISTIGESVTGKNLPPYKSVPIWQRAA